MLTELKKPRPNPLVIEKLMKRFIYFAGVLGVMQVATLVIMTKLTWDERAPPAAGHPDRDGSLALIVAGGIYLSAHLPRHVPLGPAIVLLAASIVLLVGNLIALALVPEFHWSRFFAVAKWTLLAYVIIAGLIEYCSCATTSAEGCSSC